MSAISIPLSKMSTITAICELAAVMKAPATADIKDETPEGTVLKMSALIYSANIGLDQLETARGLLRLIFMTNQGYFNCPVSSNATEDVHDEDEDKRPPKETYTREDMLDALVLGAQAAQANICVSKCCYDGKLFLSADNGESFCVTISDNDLRLAKDIFRVVCANNKFRAEK